MLLQPGQLSMTAPETALITSVKAVAVVGSPRTFAFGGASTVTTQAGVAG
jgi:hypothetical protein